MDDNVWNLISMTIPCWPRSSKLPVIVMLCIPFNNFFYHNWHETDPLYLTLQCVFSLNFSKYQNSQQIHHIWESYDVRVSSLVFEWLVDQFETSSRVFLYSYLIWNTGDEGLDVKLSWTTFLARSIDTFQASGTNYTLSNMTLDDQTRVEKCIYI